MPLKRFNAKDAELNRVQDNVGDAVRALDAGILSGARLSALISFGSPSVEVKVYHGLGRVPVGFFALVPALFADYYKLGAASTEPNKWVWVKPINGNSQTRFIFF